ncbi:MAG: hypothetical protein K2O71_07490, partial [Lachnospiraceae bacterium]|nr:hypothetical protein [Lachnospiraceae bacterium]
MRKKKIGALLMSVCMVASLTACGGDGEKEKDPTPTPAQGSEATPKPTEAAKPTEGAQDTPEPTDEAEPTPTEEASVPAGDPVVIRYGTHWVQDLDPNHVDDV